MTERCGRALMKRGGNWNLCVIFAIMAVCSSLHAAGE